MGNIWEKIIVTHILALNFWTDEKGIEDVKKGIEDVNKGIKVFAQPCWWTWNLYILTYDMKVAVITLEQIIF